MPRNLETVAEDGSEREVSERMPEADPSEASDTYGTPNDNVEGSEVRPHPVEVEDKMEVLRRTKELLEKQLETLRLENMRNSIIPEPIHEPEEPVQE